MKNIIIRNDEHTQFVSVNVYLGHVSCITRPIFYIDGILPKGPYPPCFRMADRALLEGYPLYMVEWSLSWKRCYICNVISYWLRPYSYIENRIWVRSWNCGCLVTWFCYQLIAKPGNKTAKVSWPDPYEQWLVLDMSGLKFKYYYLLIFKAYAKFWLLHSPERGKQSSIRRCYNHGRIK